MINANLKPIIEFDDLELEESVRVVTVSEFSNQLKSMIEGNFSYVKIRGEISGFKKHISGHSYFSLKDPNADAVLNAICWRGTKTKVQIEEGVDVIAFGRISTYPGRSNYQIIVSDVEAAGEGTLLKLLMERKKKFETEGLFNKKSALPKFPRIIGIVTSQTGAVIQDIIHRISDRYPCHLILWPVAVQGNGAAEQISSAIKGFNNIQDSRKPDVIIVARGGGSIEDLWPFNEENVVRATFESKIPIVSAVGHETDTTLIDYAADLRAPTPTAAAELTTPVKNQLVIDLVDRKNKMIRYFVKRLENLRLGLKSHKIQNPSQWLTNKVIKIDDLNERLSRGLLNLLKKSFEKSIYLGKMCKSPKNLLNISENKLLFLDNKYQTYIKQKIYNYENKISFLNDRLQNGSYNSVLKRGFCLISDDEGKNIKTYSEIISNKPKEIDIKFIDGKIKSMPIY